jgi:hypothetical protein
MLHVRAADRAPAAGITFPERCHFRQRPTMTPLLDGAKKLTLTIQNAGAPEQTFVWDLSP